MNVFLLLRPKLFSVWCSAKSNPHGQWPKRRIHAENHGLIPIEGRYWSDRKWRRMQRTWICLGNVAENMSVKRWPVAGISDRSTISRIWGYESKISHLPFVIIVLTSKPMSNCRSKKQRKRCLQWKDDQLVLPYDLLHPKPNIFKREKKCYASWARVKKRLVYRILASPTRPRCIRSFNRPGVATSRWLPFSKSRVWKPISAPP